MSFYIDFSDRSEGEKKGERGMGEERESEGQGKDFELNEARTSILFSPLCYSFSLTRGVG